MRQTHTSMYYFPAYIFSAVIEKVVKVQWPIWEAYVIKTAAFLESSHTLTLRIRTAAHPDMLTVRGLT